MSDAKQALWAAKPVLRGERVTLRPFVRDDAITMAAMLADPELLKLTASVVTTEAAESFSAQPDQKMYEWYGNRSEQDDRLDLGIVDNASGDLVGEVVLNDWDADANSCNFRTLMGAAGRNRGLGTEASRMIIGHGFEEIGLHRVSLDVYAFNPRAQRVYEKVGFLEEGVRRDAFRFDGDYVDEIMMAILAPEWAEHQGHPAV